VKRMATMLMLTAVIMAAAPVMTNATIEAMVSGGVPLPVIIRTIRTATQIEFFTGRPDYVRLKNAGASGSAADEIMKAIHQREYDGIDTSPAVEPVVTVAKPTRAPAPAPAPTAAVATAPGPAVPAPWSPPMPLPSEVDASNTNAAPVRPVPASAPAFPPIPAPLPPLPSSAGSTSCKAIYVDTNNGFDVFILAAFRAKHVPVKLVNSAASADCVLDSWLFHSEGSVAAAKFTATTGLSEAAFSLTSRSGEIVWAYSATKSSILVRGGKQSVAEACAKHILHDLF
jgi:hypothetical protein